MNVQRNLRGIGAVLAAASCLWFATTLTSVGDSPILRIPGAPDGYYYPLSVDPDTHVGLYAFAVLVDNKNDFTRTNPDGSQWLHFQAVNALLFIGVWDGNFESISDIQPLFLGSGKVTGSFTVVGWTADLHRFEWRWEGTLTDMETDVESPFFLHVVAKDGVFLRDNLRFAPLAPGD